jgi:ribose transport system substrate-binding protein
MMSAAFAAAMLATGGTAHAAGEKIAVITPYLAQPGTQFYVEAFEAKAKEFGWEVNVIDTKGDVAAAVGRIEDAANQKVAAIVINVDPSQVQAGLETAKAAGVPVFGMDAGATPLLVTNITSNGYAMAADTAAYVANRLGGKGNVVMFVFDAFPPVQQRGVIADTIFRNNPDIKVVERVTPDVQDGGIADRGRFRRSGPHGTSRRLAPCRPLRLLAAAARALSSPALTQIRRRVKPSPRAVTSKPPWRRTSRALAPPRLRP